MEKRNIEIERNVIESFLMSAKDALRKYRKLIVYVISGIVGVIVIGSVFYLYYEHRVKKETVKYEEIMEKYRSLKKNSNQLPNDIAMTIEQMRDLVDSSRWGFVRRMGDYILGGMYFDSKNFAEARKRYIKFAEENPRSDFSILALQKAGVAAEIEGFYDDALRLYKKLEEQYVNSEYTDQIFYDCARLYQKKGDLFKAREYYRKVISLHPRSIFSLRARHRLFLLSYQEKNLK